MQPFTDPGSRPTRAVIDLSAIVRNFRAFRERIGAGRAVLPVVKADAYGHGAVPVARRLEAEGANRFAVAIAAEGVALRRAGIRAEILLMSFSDPGDAALLFAYRLLPALYDLDQAKAFAQASDGLPGVLPVHVKLDTGMGRLGIRPEDLGETAELLKTSRRLFVAGTFTQLASAEDPAAPATRSQIQVLRSCLESLRGAGVDPGLVHVANSAALLAHPDSWFDAVRPGLALYGVPPARELADAGLAPAMALETRVMSVKRVPPGTPLGYGGSFVAGRASTVAALPIGYHDGLRRSFSGRVCVLMRGGEARIVGAVSMDLTLVDATDCSARPGDRVVVLGRDGERQVTAWDLALAADTIPYEILCGVGARVPRVYV